VSPLALAKLLRRLHGSRNRQSDKLRKDRPRRKSLTAADRAEVLRKADGRCHLCGGKVEGTAWDADHVFAHSSGGAHSIGNYLPAHKLCNSYRWHYGPEEFRLILKLGVWLKTQIEKGTVVGIAAGERFTAYEKDRVGRQRPKRPVGSRR